MAAKPAPHAHRVKVREIATGRVFEAWPVDAREMLRHPKDYEYAEEDAPLGLPSAPVTPIPPPPSLAERLDAKSYRDIQALAKKAGIDASQRKDELVEQLLPHIEAGTISLEELPPLAITPQQFPNATPAE